MSGEIIRLGSVSILVIMLLSVSLVIMSESAMASSWTDDFSGPGLDQRWTRGGIGMVGINPESGYLFAQSYTGDYAETWHGPYIRTQMAEFVDFDISAKFRCIAQEQQISRLLIRLLDQSGTQLFSFGWSDIQATGVKAEIGLYGSSFSSPISKTGSSFLYSNFYDKNIRLARSGQNLSFYIDDSMVFNDTSSQTPVSFIEVAFLKYNNVCTIDILDMNSISVSTGGTGLPGAPENLDIYSGDQYASLSWSPPADSGGLPITNYKIYRGNATGNESYLTTINNTLFYNDTGLTNGLEYFYKISAVNSFGEGPSVSGSVNLTSNTTDDPDDPIDDPVSGGSHPDTDDDGIEDDADAFPDDPAASVDTDDDGMPDDWNEGYTEEDSTSGLEVDIDDDNDGIPDTEEDDYNDISTDDLTSWKDNFTPTSSIITLIFLLIGIIIFILFVKSGDNSQSSKDPDDADNKVKGNGHKKRRLR